MVPLSDLIQIGSLIVAIIGLVYQLEKDKKNNRHY
ncbi:putative holin-like toxin [Roseburia intestinalis]|nr:putative holin-like toxin [Roseburia intestinalis]